MTEAELKALRQRLLSLLVIESQQVEAFVGVLLEEQQILGQANVEPLFPLAERKGIIARQLKQAADARVSLVLQAGGKDDRAGYESLLGSPLPEIWHKFIATAERAQTLNALNGQLITDRLSQNHQALAILMTYSDQPTVYGRDGTSRTRPGMRHLGSV